MLLSGCRVRGKDTTLGTVIGGSGAGLKKEQDLGESWARGEKVRTFSSAESEGAEDAAPQPTNSQINSRPCPFQAIRLLENGFSSPSPPSPHHIICSFHPILRPPQCMHVCMTWPGSMGMLDIDAGEMVMREVRGGPQWAHSKL